MICDGGLRAYLNLCRHRGNRVCRADRGNAKLFTCSYHGWTYSSDGKLAVVPMADAFPELDRDQWGLIPVAQIDSYKGLIFATFDTAAPPLRDYLGDMAWYLDILLDREKAARRSAGRTAGCSTPTGRPRRKISAATAIISPQPTDRRASSASTRPRAKPGNGTKAAKSPATTATFSSHGSRRRTTPGRGSPQPDDPLVDYMKEHADEIESRLGEACARGRFRRRRERCFPICRCTG